jgi:hypothetical protein
LLNWKLSSLLKAKEKTKMVDTTTIARDLVTPEVAAMLTAEAQAIMDEHPDAEETWKEHVQVITKELQEESLQGDANAIAQAEFSDDYELYALAAYCTKTINLLSQPLDPNVPKITVPHDIVTDEILASFNAELDKKEEHVTKRPGRVLHPHHVQSRERLAKMAPGLTAYKQDRQAKRTALKAAKAEKAAIAAAPAQPAIAPPANKPPKPAGGKK